MHARHSGRTSSAAAGSMGTQPHASQHATQQCSKQPARVPTAMHTTTKPAPSPVALRLTIPLPSALRPMRTYSLHLLIKLLSLINNFLPDADADADAMYKNVITG